MRYVLLTFWPCWAATLLPLPMTSPLSSPPSASTSRRRSSTRSSPNSVARVLRSLSLRDPRSLLPCLPVAELPPLPQLLLVAAVVLLPKPPRRRRRKNPLRSQMTTWDSASSIKKLLCYYHWHLPKG